MQSDHIPVARDGERGNLFHIILQFRHLNHQAFLCYTLGLKVHTVNVEYSINEGRVSTDKVEHLGD